jgi:hypothetical protein
MKVSSLHETLLPILSAPPSHILPLFTSRTGSLDAGFRVLAQCHSLAVSESEDGPKARRKYRPFLLPEDIEAKDWISELELESVIRVAEKDLASTQSRLKVLVLYGSLRHRFVPHSNPLNLFVPFLPLNPTPPTSSTAPTPNSWPSKPSACSAA